jgi:hypothetical protein
MTEGTATRTAKEASQRERNQLVAWQTRLLPFTISIVVALTVFACVANVCQVYNVQKHMTEVETDLGDLVQTEFAAPQTNGERLAIARWKTAAILESNALHSRYHQANLLLITRVYIIFLGFTTGLVMAMVGAAFILSKLRERPSEASVSGSGLSAALTSSSPGLMLAFFGTLLMVVTIVAKVDIHVTDEPLYFSESSDTSNLLIPGTANATSSTDQIANQLLNKLNKDQKK